MSEKRVDILVTWEEEHPELARGVKHKLNALQRAQTQAADAIRATIPAGKKQQRMLEALDNVVKEQTISIVGAGKYGASLKLMNKAWKEVEKEERKSLTMSKRVDKILRTLGFRMSWFGFRLLIVGRLLVRWLTMPIKRLIKSLTDWEKSMFSIALSMGYLESQGLLTAESEEMMLDTLEKLPEAGMAVQGAMGLLSAALANLAIEIAPELVSILEDFSKILIELKPFIRGIAEGLAALIPHAEGFLEAMGPERLAWMGKWGAILSPLAVALMGVGTALFFVSTAAAGLKTIAGGIGWLVAKLSGLTAGAKAAQDAVAQWYPSMTKAAGAGSTLASTLLKIVAPIATAILTFFEFVEPVSGVRVEAENLAHTFLLTAKTADELNDMVEQLDRSVPRFAESMRVLDEWIKMSDSELRQFFKNMYYTDEEIERAIQLLRDLEKEFPELRQEMRDMCFRHMAADIDVMSASLQAAQRTMHEAEFRLSALRGTLVEPAMGMPGGMGAPRMEITINQAITIESISGIADLDALYEAAKEGASKGIGEAVRRRGR